MRKDGIGGFWIFLLTALTSSALFLTLSLPFFVSPKTAAPASDNAAVTLYRPVNLLAVIKGGSRGAFLLIRINANDGRIYIAHLPDALAVASQGEVTLSAQYEAGGARHAADGVRALGVEVDRYIELSSASCRRITDALGGVEYPYRGDAQTFLGDDWFDVFSNEADLPAEKAVAALINSRLTAAQLGDCGELLSSALSGSSGTLTYTDCLSLVPSLTVIAQNDDPAVTVSLKVKGGDCLRFTAEGLREFYSVFK